MTLDRAKWRKEVVERHRFVPGQEKECFNCGVMYMPPQEMGRYGDRFSARLFCSEKCDGEYVSGALRLTQPPEDEK